MTGFTDGVTSPARNVRNAHYEAATQALTALVAAGVPVHDSRCQTLIALMFSSADSQTTPERKSRHHMRRMSRPRPCNLHQPSPPMLVPPAVDEQQDRARVFFDDNQRCVVTARLALEEAFSNTAQHADCAVQREASSVFQTARDVAAAERKSRGNSQLNGAKEPVEDRDKIAGIPAERAFQIKAQVELYRRLIRNADIPNELKIASQGIRPSAPRPFPGPVVVRGADSGDDADISFEPSLQLPVDDFDVRTLPIFPVNHRFTERDVVRYGEKLDRSAIEERLLLARVHHERMYAQQFETAQQGVNDKFVPRLDPRARQQRAELLETAGVSDDDCFPASSGTVPVSPIHLTNSNLVAQPSQFSIKPSHVRDRAAVPVSVLTIKKFMPPYQALLVDREERIAARARMRLAEISALPKSVPQDVKRRAIIELKQIKLLGLQRSVREQIMGTMHKVLNKPPISDLRKSTQQHFRRRSHTFVYAPPSVYASAAGVMAGRANGQRMDVKHRVEQEARRRARRVNMMNNLMNHAFHFRTASHGISVVRKRLLKDLERYFRDKSREEERRKKKEQMDRLRALRNNNEDEYLELLKTTKNKRLIQLLKQTDAYLMQIGAQVERQKQSAREEDEEADRVHGKAEEKENATQVAQDKKEDAHMEGDDELQQMKKRRNDYYTITHTISEKVYQPTILVGGKLKPYQLEGLEWLVSLFNNNLNGILADEMGLGKTIQTLSLITYLVEVKKVSGPFLVIVPLSVMSNWVRELDHWAPSLTKVVYRGDPATRKNIQMFEMAAGTYNILLTTYEFVVKDKNVLGRVRWKYIIMDEGHRMKNADCKLALTLGAKYSSRNRLLLTGTPLQNNMTELWALLNFLLPSIFSSAETFETWFNAPFHASSLGESAELNEEENLLIISRLHQVLRPFMLRRLKTDVEAQLPDKVENVFRCEMSVWQRVLYRQMRAKLGIAAGAGNCGVRSFNNMVMQLKKVCNHPYLFYDDDELTSLPTEFLMRASGKFELLDHALRKLKKTGHRVLMFSQMTAALDYLEYFLRTIGMKHLRLDGTTKADDRQDMLEMFNAEDSEYFCFLLSTRAGGLGLNLQTADTVIIFDSDWNPMMDLQAQDRAHRIGQTKEVRVYRLICSGSIEVKILERANRKLQIDAQVIQAGQFNNKSSDNDRQEMLKDLLRQQAGDDTVVNADVTSLSELNRKLARSEEEFELFEEMDAQDAAERKGQPRLLIAEDELPSWVLQPEVNQKSEEQVQAEYILEHGRGRRKRKEVLYDDNLTEKEWTTAMEEEGDVAEAVQRKRRKISAQATIVESSSGDEEDDSADVKFSPDTTIKVENDMKAELEEGEVDEEEAHDMKLMKKLEPFVDPELNRVPKVKRKRGRPRKNTRRRDSEK